MPRVKRLATNCKTISPTAVAREAAARRAGEKLRDQLNQGLPPRGNPGKMGRTTGERGGSRFGKTGFYAQTRNVNTQPEHEHINHSRGHRRQPWLLSRPPVRHRAK